MCEVKYTFVRCARHGCGRSEYITETVYRCLKPQNCNGLGQIRPVESDRQDLECSIHFYEYGEQDEYGPNTEHTEASNKTIDSILKNLPENHMESKTTDEIKRPNLHMKTSYDHWCNQLDKRSEADEDLEVPDLSECGTESDESVISDDDYVAYRAFEIRPRMRRRRVRWTLRK